MQTNTQSIITILVIAVITLFTRALPFILFPANRKIPDIIKYAGQVLPFAVIGMLVVYCLKSVSFLNAPFGLPEAISIIYVVIAHKWKHNLLVSIGGGTVLYMAMIKVFI